LHVHPELLRQHLDPPAELGERPGALRETTDVLVELPRIPFPSRLRVAARPERPLDVVDSDVAPLDGAYLGRRAVIADVRRLPHRPLRDAEGPGRFGL